MKRSILIALAVLPLFFSSCATSSFFSQTAADISPIALVEPFAFITDAIGDWPTSYLEEASSVNQRMVAEIVSSMGLPIQATVPMAYHTPGSAETDVWMRRFADMGSARAKELEIPANIRDAVTGSGCRYGLLITDIGYLKNPDEYKLEKTMDITGRVLEAVVNNNIIFGSNATDAYLNGVFAMVFDNQTGKVVWYGAQPRRNKKNPVDLQSLTKQLQALFKDFK